MPHQRRLAAIGHSLLPQSPQHHPHPTHTATAAAGGTAAGPVFSFRQLGGVAAGERWIYASHADGTEEAIARLEHRVIEQPEQNLRYFNKNRRPVNLRDIKLKPGGRPLISGFQLYWNFDGNMICTELMDVVVEGQGSDELTLIVITQDPGGVATSRRRVTVSFDAASESYVWDVVCELELHSPEVFDSHIGDDNTIAFEVTDPWYCDVPAPTVEDPMLWTAGAQRRFSWLLADEADGTTWKMPLNHLATGIPAPQAFARDGMLVLGVDPGNCPAFQFVGETADRTAISVCSKLQQRLPSHLCQVNLGR